MDALGLMEDGVDPDDSASQVASRLQGCKRPAQGPAGPAERSKDLLSMLGTRVGPKARKTQYESVESPSGTVRTHSEMEGYLAHNFFKGTSDPAHVTLFEAFLKLPKSVQQRVRLVGVGYGSRLRDCILCDAACNSTDPILGTLVFIMWGHLEEDHTTVQGYVCYYCCSIMRRRFRSWKLRDLQEHLRSEANKEQFLEWRDLDIRFRKDQPPDLAVQRCH